MQRNGAAVEAFCRPSWAERNTLSQFNRHHAVSVAPVDGHSVCLFSERCQMPLAQESWNPCRLQFLMDLTGVLADYSRRPEFLREIPDYLSRAFQTGPFTLAVIH